MIAGAVVLAIGALILRPDARCRDCNSHSAQSDLRNGIAAAKTYFAPHDSYAGFTPAAADRIEPSLTWSSGHADEPGTVGIVSATDTQVLLVSTSFSGTTYCFGDDSSDGQSLGKVDASSLDECTGGW